MASPVYVYEQLKPYLNCDDVGGPGGGGGQNPRGQGRGGPTEGCPQLAGHALPGLSELTDCDVASLPAALVAVDEACCLGLGPSEPGPAAELAYQQLCGAGGRGPQTCSTSCAVRLLPLANSTCRAVLDLLYDMHDGRRDGVASVFEDTAKLCREIPPSTVVAQLTELRSAGTCAAHGVSLVGKAEEAVGDLQAVCSQAC